MSVRDRIRLALLLNRGTRRRLVTANVGLSLGVTLVVLFASVGKGLERTLLDDVLGALPITQLKVQPRPIEALGINLGSGRSGRRIDAETVAAIAAMDEVVAIHPILYAHFPVSIEGEVLGSTYGTDAPVQGVDPAWVAHDVDPAYAFAFEEQGALPVLVSRKVLQAYNAGFATANRLPQLTEGVIVGQSLRFDLGSSTLGGTNAGRERRDAVIAGFSDRVDPLALAVPIELVRHYTERFGGDPDALDAMVIAVRDADDLTAIESAVARAGLELAPDAFLGRQVGRGVTIVTLMLSAVGVAVVVLSLLNIANTLVLVLRERRYELAVARALGVSERGLTAILVFESVLSGAFGAGAALGASLGALWLGAKLLEGAIAPVLGTALRFTIPGALALAVLILTPIAAALATLLPARRAVGAGIAASLRR